MTSVVLIIAALDLFCFVFILFVCLFVCFCLQILKNYFDSLVCCCVKPFQLTVREARKSRRDMAEESDEEGNWVKNRSTYSLKWKCDLCTMYDYCNLGHFIWLNPSPSEMPTSGDLKSGDCLFCSTTNIKHPCPHNRKSTQSPNYDMDLAQDIIRSLT